MFWKVLREIGRIFSATSEDGLKQGASPGSFLAESFG
jgi:hypothetical protein